MRLLKRVPVVALFLITLVVLIPGVTLAATDRQPTVSEPYWPVFPQSPQASSTQQLFWVTIGLCFVILAIVFGALLIIMVRFRARPGQGEPRQIYQNRKLEFWWTIIPAIMLLGVFVYSVRTLESLMTISSDALPITIIGHQWWWEVRYPDSNVITANEIHVPAGRQIRFTLESADVVHNFWIPVLGGKEQLIPGHVNTWTYTTEKPGTYDGECSEYCGGAHAWMRLRLVADTPAQFNAWLAQQKPPATIPSAANTQEALQIFNKNACGQCHTIQGLSGANGTVGPDLTHIGSRATIGAGRLVNNTDNMTAWLHDAQAWKPGSYMPNLHLDEHDSQVLAQFLEELK